MSDESAFDVIIIGTGLTESITAAALSKAGFKVAHLDQNPYYGGDEASLTLDEYIEWVGESPSSPKIPNSRQYTISLSPSVIPATGPLISSLVGSGVSRYGEFRLVEAVAVYRDGKVQTVPGSKEDIFKDKNISLLDKRRLMRFLVFASGNGEFENRRELQDGRGEMPFIEFLKSTFTLNQETAETIAYALSFCTFPSDKTLPALHRLRRYLRSAGRYGSSPFLIGHYGSSGEIAQGFCRAAAVSGGVYILGRSISSITRNKESESGPTSPTYSVTLSDFPEPITSNVLISSDNRLPKVPVLEEGNTGKLKRLHSEFPFPPLSVGELGEGGEYHGPSAAIARCVCIIDQPLSFALGSDIDLVEAAGGAEAEAAAETEAETEAITEAEPPSRPLDTGILVFPPSSPSTSSVTGDSSATPTGAVTALIVGESTMSVPRGKWIIYLSTPLSPAMRTIDPEKLLKPYLDAVLSLSAPPTPSTSASFQSSSAAGAQASTRPQIEPLFKSFYIEREGQRQPSAQSTEPSSGITPNPSSNPDILIAPSPLLAFPSTSNDTPDLPPNLSPLPDVADAAAVNAEVVFWETVQALKRKMKKMRQEGGESEGDVKHGQGEGEIEIEIESFWPPLESVDEEGDDE
ncbi:hypothetical protein GYMLUDRAFT_244766 [Collybiopsis luxurians FD-317 M1]|uniref:FAD/NAD(P)-binding domain-containing protein n=1 Tax=Collybiopsis luxurians FD-317 M1 TaxID=944289 RepID=A0A0D0CBW1_9AGAR|nr:hypothetical protein GYMLUDRAFT_244766 [Collybiopsis luxurians FD-317 M1]